MAGPLKGLKILDFTTLLPGPFATMTLADLGADVLQVVSGSRPDLTAFWPPFIPGTKLSAATAMLGRGKRSLTLNLKDKRAAAIVEKLIAEYDIVIEQFRPGVMARLGLDYETLCRANPALIYCSLTGYGQTGPMKDRAGHDINYLSRAGVMSYSGRKETGPTLTGMQIADVASGSNNAIIGILAAVIHRERVGEGQHIDVSMTDGVVAFNTFAGTAFLAGGQEPGMETELLNGGSLYDFYETSDGKYLSFGGLEPQFFSAFCAVIGRPDLIPGGVAPAELLKIKEEVQAIIKTKSRDEWCALFAKTDACVEPVLSLAETLADPQTWERGMVIETPLPGGKTIKQIGHPIRYSATPPEYGPAGSPAGTHTQEVLSSIGYQEAEIEEFARTGLFA
ncbi:MAG: CoA transferase [Syntrophales bacterium]|jgi:crotonobetainyl-CoA:carnitine CoA-transferase CaiB-like acyl-CoA transferase|nr:CoA transferase [Syntrophales bacterium]